MRDDLSTGQFIFRALGIVAGVCLVALVIWIIEIGFSSVAGRGNAEIARNSAENWTTQQARFEELYAQIRVDDANLSVLKTALDADPTNPLKQTEFTGLQLNCKNNTAEYDALARTFMAENFRDTDLPFQIDVTNPLTDCEA